MAALGLAAPLGEHGRVARARGREEATAWAVRTASSTNPGAGGARRPGYASRMDASPAGSHVSHLAVVGLMGSGKTSVGRALAARLGWPLHDSDAWIEARTGRTVRELRAELGVDAMHDLERAHLLAALAADGPTVVAPAASVIDDVGCRTALTAPGVRVVWLTASPAVAAARFRSGDHRPWYGADPEAFLREQAQHRGPLFASLRPVQLATDARSPDELATAALDALGITP